MGTSIKNSKRWVVKVGSSLVTNDGRGLDTKAISHWASQLVAMQKAGVDLVLVSSGAVAEGVARLGLKVRPKAVHVQQAAAAVGQMGLAQAYESSFMKHNIHTAQILLSHDDLSDRTRYLNARSTLTTLLEMGVVPVVNENDTVATAELCFGDNDTLAALVANLINADLMVILTDQDGLYESDPRFNKEAEMVKSASANDTKLMAMAGAGSSLGRGGMQTKVSAARLAARSGTSTVIANGREDQVLSRLLEGETLGTFLEAGSEPVTARKQWLASQLTLKGSVTVDDGAVNVLKKSGKSLLAVGISKVTGQFSRGEVVACVDQAGKEIARGLVNYSADEIELLKGKSSDNIEDLLGYAAEAEIIHRDNLVLSD
ncbi:MAG: glutamate 5-kinase [Gammaproteobacteria bacterium]|jgi:glutamate 5-kinase|nr:glutamate 5-kinase [Gammaproteobacteria bacterium]MBT3859391.1 glutamate 5-kinase [Gammaproteobacteria bacterium]MBT3988153.1 glutamate 5-kinase [Gammaproteobacteria bacterium]MBT4256177.1 glutamate 5-kinase [Gammaproteobacteria bacterium]MBT4583382.1 glutamate 5-kinase [Gammaproteobacteria bacterium]